VGGGNGRGKSAFCQQVGRDAPIVKGEREKRRRQKKRGVGPGQSASQRFCNLAGKKGQHQEIGGKNFWYTLGVMITKPLD